ncbi:hypothetical protein F4861DRAFT_496838 [Xylaria intraflava]|nr:hypothetical protein F4861DRAFT_496838 [Xylaria intraflava]
MEAKLVVGHYIIRHIHLFVYIPGVPAPGGPPPLLEQTTRQHPTIIPIHPSLPLIHPSICLPERAGHDKSFCTSAVQLRCFYEITARESSDPISLSIASNLSFPFQSPPLLSYRRTRAHFRAMATYRSTPLFGGALVCDLPAKFTDVSQLRQVPDNQEVYIDKDGFTSVIIEVNERVGGDGSSAEIDGEALTTHLEEIVGKDDVDHLEVWNTTSTRFSNLDEDIPAYTLIATLSPQQRQPSTDADSSAPRRNVPDFTAMILTLVRLEREKTDLLITINVPHIRGEYDEDDVDLQLGKQGKLIGDAVDYAARIWESFKIKDWGLFDEL